MNKCENCSKRFIPKRTSKGKYCSRKCYWVDKSFGEKPNCIDCGVKVSTYHTKRCRNCSDKFRRGENHHLWIKDRSNLSRRDERNDQSYREWRRQVWLRDSFKCKIANPDCKGRIEAHHILSWREYPELRYDINNGITLCQAHHPRIRAEEKRLSPFFQALVSVSNR
jgi:hypothetical protein